MRRRAGKLPHEQEIVRALEEVYWAGSVSPLLIIRGLAILFSMPSLRTRI